MGQTVNETKPTLLERTRELLADRPRALTLRKIADDTGLTFGFLHHISIGSAKDPGVNNVQKLYEYLSGRKLDVA